jgi:AcrR family transcriptional regulator
VPEPRVERRRTLVRTEFVDAARSVIEEHGVQGFSLELVGRQMGLRKQAVYHYFDSKEAVLFEVVYEELARGARAVSDAVDTTRSGADAVEALLRAYFEAFRGRPRLFQLAHTAMPMFDLARLATADRLARLRPLNDLLLAGVAKRVARDRGPGADPGEARRFAFTAYTAVVGLLTMKSLVEAAGDPLVHRDEALIDTLVSTYRNAATRRSPSR